MTTYLRTLRILHGHHRWPCELVFASWVPQWRHSRKAFTTTCPATLLRVGPGQNSQIIFISVEQLSLNVADDSAKTLSVLRNMGDSLDDCLLRFLQMCRRPPQKYPRFWGPTDFFKILPKKDPYRNHTKSMN